MWSIPAALWAISTLVGDVSPETAIAPADFQHWFADSCAGKLRILVAVEKEAQRLRYVFVGGLHNEFLPGYFSQNIKELKAHGISRRAIHEIYPSSRKTVEENREAFRDELLKVADAGEENLVVIAHSRGACDALVFALENPEFIRDRVAFLFLVQGPFGGSPLVDYVLGEGRPMDHQVPMRHRIVGNLTAKMEKSLLKRGVHGGLAALSPDASLRFWDRMLDEQAYAIPVVGPKTFYITSQVDPSELGSIQSATGRYLGAYHGPNDGMVPLSGQVLPDLGTDLGALEVGHSDLTQRYPVSHAPRRFRQALVESILMAVGQADAQSQPGDTQSTQKTKKR
jgi:pimeloyl-ACP methyl ester carboxylesterase